MADFDTYLCTLDGSPGAITVDLDRRPDPTRPKLVRVRLRVQAPDEHGLPMAAEQRSLAEVQQRLAEGLAPDAVLVGAVTVRGRRDVCLYARPADDLAARVRALVPDADVQVDNDPSWRLFTDVLTPDERGLHGIRNWRTLDAVRDRIDPSKPREVVHTARFPTDEARMRFRGQVVRGGFQWQDLDGDDFVIELRHVVPVDEKVVFPVSDVLYELAKQLGGTYEGWRTKEHGEEN